MAIPVFVINLPRSRDRRARVAAAFASIDRPIQFVDAADGLASPTSADVGVPDPLLTRALTPGEIGCLQSHLNVLRHIVDAGLPLACVCEDDVCMADGAREVFAALDVLLDQRTSVPWDLLLLGHHSSGHPPVVGARTCMRSAPFAGTRMVAQVAEFAMGAYAYVVTRRGAERLLAFARPLRMPMDWVTGYSPACGVDLFAVTPPCVLPDPLSGAATTIPDRAGGRGVIGGRWRRRAGRAWMMTRRLGLWPGSYARAYRR